MKILTTGRWHILEGRAHCTYQQIFDLISEEEKEFTGANYTQEELKFDFRNNQGVLINKQGKRCVFLEELNGIGHEHYSLNLESICTQISCRHKKSFFEFLVREDGNLICSIGRRDVRKLAVTFQIEKSRE
jgi:hypothetical protein